MSDLEYKIEAFAEWIAANGGAVLNPTNEWEVLRFRSAAGALGVLYKNKRNEHRPTGAFVDLYKEFLNATGLAPSKRISRAVDERKRKIKRAIRKRDPDLCCYCGQFFSDAAPETLEHFHAIAKTGNNHMDNCGRACMHCNVAVGDLPVVQKIFLRDKIREMVASTSPWETFVTPRNFGLPS